MGTLRFGIYYKGCTLRELGNHMMSETANCKIPESFDRVAIEWMDSNKEMVAKMKSNEKLGVGITAEDFSDLSNPPYRMTKDDYKMFLGNYDQMQHFTNASNPEGHFQAYYDTDFDTLYFAKTDVMHYGGENVTSQVLCMWRYVFLRDVLLKGQDAEFNIYRSYYLDPQEGKIVLSVLSLALQIALTVSISIAVFNGWDDIKTQKNPLVIVCSVLAFCFISYSTQGTGRLFRRFYKDIGLAYDLPLFMMLCDYISNVLISWYICCLSLFFLLQTDGLEDLVLNSMALTFIIELDDVINIFDSDEEVVIIADLTKFAETNCESPRKIQYKAKHFVGVLFAPIIVVGNLHLVVEQFYKLFLRKGHRKRMQHRQQMMKRLNQVREEKSKRQGDQTA